MGADPGSGPSAGSQIRSRPQRGREQGCYCRLACPLDTHTCTQSNLPPTETLPCHKQTKRHKSCMSWGKNPGADSGQDRAPDSELYLSCQYTHLGEHARTHTHTHPRQLRTHVQTHRGGAHAHINTLGGACTHTYTHTPWTVRTQVHTHGGAQAHIHTPGGACTRTYTHTHPGQKSTHTDTGGGPHMCTHTHTRGRA